MITNLKTLVNDILANRCVAFIGAGFSSAVGLPSGQELNKKLQDLLNEKFDPDVMLDESAQQLEAIYGRQPLIENIINIICDTQDTVPLPTSIHRNLIELPIRTYITTNFDTLLEKNLTLMHKVFRTIRGPASFVIANDRNHYVLKYHGCIEDPNSIIVTKCDYDKVTSIFKSYLIMTFARYTTLILGYSMRDPDFIELLDIMKNELNDLQRPKFAVMKKISNEEREGLLKNYRIHVIEDDLNCFLFDLIQQLPKSVEEVM